MTKRIHPAESSRKLVGVATGVALVGIVTGLQFSANAMESDNAQANPTVTPTHVSTSPGTPEVPETAAVPEAVPAPADPATQQFYVPEAAPAAPAAAAPAPAAPAAPAAAAPAPAAPAAPAAPVNGTTAASGG